MKKITVVVPCYNYAKYLPECIASIKRQTHKDIEILVVNDGSQDNTEEVCKELEVKCLTKPNGGLSSARNYGIKHASNEFIMCLDADDILSNNSIELHLRNADKGVISQCALLEFGDSFSFRVPNETNKLAIWEGNSIYCNSVFHKDDWDKVGGYDESEIMRNGYEDWEFWIRLFLNGCVVKICPEIGLLYRIHQSSMTRTTTRKNHHELVSYIREKNKALYEKSTQ
jgi:glycosyltransferase involved in cell wall biosynthesis